MLKLILGSDVIVWQNLIYRTVTILTSNVSKCKQILALTVLGYSYRQTLMSALKPIEVNCHDWHDR